MSYYLLLATNTRIQIKLISIDTISGFTSTQIYQIPIFDVSGFTPSQITALSTSAVSGFTSSQITALSTSAVSGFTSSQITALSTSAVSGFTSSQLSLLSSSNTLGSTFVLTSSQLYSLINQIIYSITTEQFIQIFTIENNKSILAGVDLHGKNLTNVNFSNASLTNADLSYSYLVGANLTSSDLSSANLTGVISGSISGNPTLPTNWKLINGYLTGPYANLIGANLTSTNLTSANLTGANLTGANLTGANLTSASLTGVYLYSANLSGANLTGANLTGAKLFSANLSGANLTSANLSGANFTNITGVPILSPGWLLINGSIVYNPSISISNVTSLSIEELQIIYQPLLKQINPYTLFPIYNLLTTTQKSSLITLTPFVNMNNCISNTHAYFPVQLSDESIGYSTNSSFYVSSGKLVNSDGKLVPSYFNFESTSLYEINVTANLTIITKGLTGNIINQQFSIMYFATFSNPSALLPISKTLYKPSISSGIAHFSSVWSTQLAIMGHGYFQLKMADGSVAYTRSGTMTVSSTGQLCLNGYPLEPAIITPPSIRCNISPSGVVSVSNPSDSPYTINSSGDIIANPYTTQTVGQIKVAIFTNPSGLIQINTNIYAESLMSGNATPMSLGVNGAGFLIQNPPFSVKVTLENLTLYMNRPITSCVPLSVHSIHSITSPQYTYTIYPNLPDGIQLDYNSGSIYGTPTTIIPTTTYTITVSNGVLSQSHPITITILQPTTFTTTLSIPTIKMLVNVNNQSFLPVVVSPPLSLSSPYTFKIFPPLPTGISLNPNTGVISGTPTCVSNHHKYTMTVSDGIVNQHVTLYIIILFKLDLDLINLEILQLVDSESGSYAYTQDGTFYISSLGEVTHTSGMMLVTSNYNSPSLYHIPSNASQVIFKAPGKLGFIINGNSYWYPTLLFGNNLNFSDYVTDENDTLNYLAINTYIFTNSNPFSIGNELYIETTSNRIYNGGQNVTFKYDVTFSYQYIPSLPDIDTTSYYNGTLIAPFTPTIMLDGLDQSSLNYTFSPELPCYQNPKIASIGDYDGTTTLANTPLITNPTSSYTITSTDKLGNTKSAYPFTFPVLPSSVMTTVEKIIYIGDSISFSPIPTPTSGVTFAISPPLPSGLTMNTTGNISGTPTMFSNKTAYTVTISNGSNGSSNTFYMIITFNINLLLNNNPNKYIKLLQVNGSTIYSNTGYIAFLPVLASTGEWVNTSTLLGGITNTNINWKLVHSSGCALEPPLVIPYNTKSLVMSNTGAITATLLDDTTAQIGTIQIDTVNDPPSQIV